MNTNLRIAIYESSLIIRNGLGSLLKKINGLPVVLSDISEGDSLGESLRIQKPDILIANPYLLQAHSLAHWREEGGNTELKIIALVSTLLPEEMLRDYDAQITLYDRAEAIKQTILKLVETQEDTEVDDEPQSLSAREKEIVVCVVKGMTNREIADRLYLSTHTVITHRRNIARKLQIHSASGLTIYAIVNKLVELGDIQQVKPQM